MAAAGGLVGEGHPTPRVKPRRSSKVAFGFVCNSLGKRLDAPAWMCFLAHLYVKMGTAEPSVCHTALLPLLKKKKVNPQKHLHLCLLTLCFPKAFQEYRMSGRCEHSHFLIQKPKGSAIYLLSYQPNIQTAFCAAQALLCRHDSTYKYPSHLLHSVVPVT